MECKCGIRKSEYKNKFILATQRSIDDCDEEAVVKGDDHTRDHRDYQDHRDHKTRTIIWI